MNVFTATKGMIQKKTSGTCGKSNVHPSPNACASQIRRTQTILMRQVTYSRKAIIRNNISNKPELRDNTKKTVAIQPPLNGLKSIC